MKKTFLFALCAISFITKAQRYVDDVYEKGYLKDGQRFRVWEFYDDDKNLELKFDFTTGRIYYIKPATHGYVVQKGNSWVDARPSVYPIYAFGTRNFYNHLKEKIRFPPSASFYNKSGRAAVLFTVDTLGKAVNFELIERFGYGSDYDIIQAMEAIPNVWIPAILNGKKCNARFILPIIFNSGKGKIREKPFEQTGTILKPLIISSTAMEETVTVAEINFENTPTYRVVDRGDFIEEYEVVENTEVKNGTYLKYKRYGAGVQFIERGTYDQNIRHGLWQEFFNVDRLNLYYKNNLKSAGNYKNGFKDGVWENYHPDDVKTEVSGKSNRDSVSILIDHKILRVKSRGSYTKDVRVGQWTSFDWEGDTVRLYDFTTHQLLFDKEIRDVDKFNENQKPLYEGGLTGMFVDFNSVINHQNLSGFLTKDSTSLRFSIVVTATGKTFDVKLLSGKLSNQAIKKIVEAFMKCNNWIPAYRGGRAVEASCVYDILFRYEKYREKNYNGALYSVRISRADE